MAYNFSALKEKAKSTEEFLRKELSVIRTGRATPAILDSVLVESFNTKMPLKQLASITVEDPKTLRVSPWDPSTIKPAEKAVSQANLGLSIAVDDQGLRLSFPDLTSERRTLLLKTAKEKLEEGKIKLRVIRDEIWKDIQAKEKEGSIREDEKFRLKDEMQKVIDGTTKNMETMYANKEKEIQS